MQPQDYEFQSQAALNQQGINAEQSAQAPYMLQNQQVNQAALVEQINPNKILREIKLTLEGKEENELGEIKQIGTPLMNDKGIGNVILLCKSIVNQNTIMSSLKDSEIGKLIIQLGDDITDDLTLNWKDYEIRDKIKLDIIEDIILNMSFMALKRALNGGEKRFLGRVTVENISSQPRMPMQKKDSFLSRFKL